MKSNHINQVNKYINWIKLVSYNANRLKIRRFTGINSYCKVLDKVINFILREHTIFTQFLKYLCTRSVSVVYQDHLLWFYHGIHHLTPESSPNQGGKAGKQVSHTVLIHQELPDSPGTAGTTPKRKWSKKP